MAFAFTGGYAQMHPRTECAAQAAPTVERVKLTFFRPQNPGVAPGPKTTFSNKELHLELKLSEQA